MQQRLKEKKLERLGQEVRTDADGKKQKMGLLKEPSQGGRSLRREEQNPATT